MNPATIEHSAMFYRNVNRLRARLNWSPHTIPQSVSPMAVHPNDMKRSIAQTPRRSQNNTAKLYGILFWILVNCIRPYFQSNTGAYSFAVFLWCSLNLFRFVQINGWNVHNPEYNPNRGADWHRCKRIPL